jgi:hypothetical protein
MLLSVTVPGGDADDVARHKTPRERRVHQLLADRDL